MQANKRPMLFMGLAILAILLLGCGIAALIVTLQLANRPDRDTLAQEAMAIYPDSTLVQQSDNRTGGNYAVRSTYYTTSDSVDEVMAFYAELGTPNVLLDEPVLDFFLRNNTFEAIIRGEHGGYELAAVHQTVCQSQVYDDCLTTIVIPLADTGDTMIIISYGIRFL